jgi:hypothetical protein
VTLQQLRSLGLLAAKDPIAATYQVRAYLNPEGVWQRYTANARKSAIKPVRLVLSFDCDTKEDIRVAWDVHSRLMDMGVRPAYAVPGALLQEGAETYRRIAETGAEFMNHGGVSHTYFDDQAGHYKSCFFYDELEPARVAQDVIEGDQIVKDVLGISPLGFRTPHFGTYQRPDQLRFLHDTLKQLGYRFSSSTTPYWAIRKGPIFNDFGIAELPVTGVPSRPLNILDTWAYFEAPNRMFEPADYKREAYALAGRFEAAECGLLNIYADPSHIHNNEMFFDSVAALVAVAPSVHFADIVGSA